MTPQQIKDKVLAAWLAQMEKYAVGPVVGEIYCHYSGCKLCCKIPQLDNFISCTLCPLNTPGKFHCTTNLTYRKLLSQVMASRDSKRALIKITPQLTAAMKLRHEFYVQGYEEVLKDAPPERFVKGGFPELLEIDRELAEGIK